MNTSTPGHFCPFCGQPVLPTWKHCPGCGQQVLNIETPDVKGSVPATITEIEGKNHPAGGDNRWAEAVLQMRMGELELAHVSLAALSRDYPQDANVLALLGELYLRQYHAQEARQYLDQAILLEPNSPLIHLRMADYWVALGVPSRAFEEITRAEEYAAGNAGLLIKIRDFSKRLKEKTRGNILLETPVISSGYRGIFKRTERNVSKKLEKEGSYEL